MKRGTCIFQSPDNHKIKFLSHTTFCTSVQNWKKSRELKTCHVFLHSELELGFQIVPVLSVSDTTSHKTMADPRENIRFKKLTKTTTKPIYICLIRHTCVIIIKETLWDMILQLVFSRPNSLSFHLSWYWGKDLVNQSGIQQFYSFSFASI